MRAQPSRFAMYQQLAAAVERAAEGQGLEHRAHLMDLRAFIFTLAREDQERQRAAVVFREISVTLWEVGEPGATRVVAATSMGVQAAHQALLGERPAAGKALTRAVRVTAAAWARRAGCPRLADLMPRIGERDGSLEYKPGPHAPELVLR